MTQITFLVHRGKEYTVQKYLRSWGGDLRGVRVRVRNYPGLRSTGRTLWKRLEGTVRAWRLGTLEGPAGPPGTPQIYVFTDFDRLDERETEIALELRRRLAGHDDTLRVLNHPLRSVRRYDLLKTLHAEGSNDFDIYRASELSGSEPKRWPVFLRDEDDHGGMSELLHGPEELRRALAPVPEPRRAGKLVVEFCDVADADGVVRKYGAFRVGERLLARQIHFSRDWVVRFPDIRIAETTREELDYVRSNPHAEELRRIFELAHIDYGRIDYSVVEGRIQVWEINTNPMILIPKDRDDPLRREAHDTFGRAFNEALEALAR